MLPCPAALAAFPDKEAQIMTQFKVLGPESRKALEALLDVADARREAAEILRPLYEADSASEQLLKVHHRPPLAGAARAGP